MNHNATLVSVIIPVFNAGQFLRVAVESVISQDYRPLEIILVDDGSSDATPDVISELAKELGDVIVTAWQTNAGSAAARNHGLELARGDLIAFLDADDIWTDHKLVKQVGNLSRHPNRQVLIGATQRVRSKVVPTGQSAATSSSENQLESTGPAWMLFSLGAGLFRRVVFETVGRFDQTLPYGEEVDWFLRAREQGLTIGVSPDVVQLYRQHDGNMTRDTLQRDQHFLLALKKSLDRRRVGGHEVTDLSDVPELENIKPVNWNST